MSRDDELVMCIRREKLTELFGDFHGYLPFTDGRNDLKKLLNDEHIVWLRRGDCETNVNYKQIIPYVVLLHGGADELTGDLSVFRYTRMQSSGEQRLAGQMSIGLGGHVNPTDGDGRLSAADAFIACVDRELAEEVLIDATLGHFQATGLINHDENEVGKVHLGVAIQVTVSAPCVHPAEDSQGECGFYPVRSLIEAMTGFRRFSTGQSEKPVSGYERWTEILLESEFFGPAELWNRDVIVEVRGGVVQAVYARDKSLRVSLLDWDNVEESATEEDAAVSRKLLPEDRTEEDNEILASLETRREAEILEGVANDFFYTVY